MRLGVNPRAERLFGRLPRPTAYSALELLLLGLIAVQAARLIWTLVTPVGPVGDWKAPGAAALPAGGASLGQFDPFFRLSGEGGPAVVTSLNLKLYGVREDRATGRGSAIIALPDGTQRSFAVGEEVMPGVTLAEVGFDSATINRNGTLEQIFLDQSPGQAVPGASPGQPEQPAQNPQAAPTPAVAGGAPVQLQPRIRGDRIDGIVVNPGSDGGQALRAAGLAPGDVIVSIGGQRVTSVEQARSLMSGSGSTVTVDRGGNRVTMRVRFNP
jgi:general secretion pathway protein C